MTRPTRQQTVTMLSMVVGIPLLIVGIGIGLMSIGARAAGRALGDVFKVAILNGTAGLVASQQLKEAANVALERDQRGVYVVSGKLMPEPRRLESLDAVRTALHALPHRGTAFVSAQSKADQASLEDVVRNEGFALVRGSYHPVSLPGRRPPTRR